MTPDREVRDALVKALREDIVDPRVPVEVRRHCSQAIAALSQPAQAVCSEAEVRAEVIEECAAEANKYSKREDDMGAIIATAIRALAAHPATPQSRGGADAVTVPREPTQELYFAFGVASIRDLDWPSFQKRYKSMLDAALTGEKDKP